MLFSEQYNVVDVEEDTGETFNEYDCGEQRLTMAEESIWSEGGKKSSWIADDQGRLKINPLQSGVAFQGV